jgi:uncharacterized protein YbjT (DUF2867 family)
VPRARLQTAASVDVGRAVADVAERPARMGRIDVAGPEIADARDMARSWRAITGRHAVLVPVPIPGKLGRALRGGVLTAEVPDIQATTPFASWLTAAQR